jgi:hypothetical protein
LQTIYLAGSEHHYEQPMVLLAGRSPVDSLAKPLLSDTSSSSTAGNISPRSVGTFDRSPVRMLPPSGLRAQLRVNTSIVTAATAAKPAGGSSSGSSSDSYGSSSSGGAAAPFRLPGRTKEALGRLLDKPVAGGNDWRLLAERLNIHRYTAPSMRAGPAPRRPY